MSVINMFRKEALRHQYKSKEFGHSVIKQPGILNNLIIGLCFIVLITFICLQFVTLTTKQSYQVKMSSDNYQPLVRAKAIVMSQQLVADGVFVKKNQEVASFELIGSEDGLSSEPYIRAPSSGIYFQEPLESNVIPAYQPFGYILKAVNRNEFFFWIKQKTSSPIRVGEKVTLVVDNHQIHGLVSVIVGGFIDGRGQKMLIAIEDSSRHYLLSPSSQIKLFVGRQSKTLMQLLNE